jgi:hypothetical protein
MHRKKHRKRAREGEVIMSIKKPSTEQRKMEAASNYDIKKYPNLHDRQITSEGRALVLEGREEPVRYDPDDGLVHVRNKPANPTGWPVLCGRTGAASVSSASGFWGPEGVGFKDICRECYEIEHHKVKVA